MPSVDLSCSPCPRPATTCARFRPTAPPSGVVGVAARSLPHTLRRVDAGEETLAELEVLVGFDDDLVGESTRLINRIRGLSPRFIPRSNGCWDPSSTIPPRAEMPARHGGPDGLRTAGRRRLLTIARKLAPRMVERLVGDITAALEGQSVSVPGSAAAESVLPRLVTSLRQTLDQRKQVATEVERTLDAHTLLPTS